MFIIIPLFASFVSIGFAIYLIRSLKNKSCGNETMIEIQNAIREGSRAYLSRQNKTVFWVSLVIALLIWYFFNFTTAFGFLVGAFGSGLAGYLGMMTAVETNAKTAEAARGGISGAFKIAFRGGSVTGFFVVGIALFITTVFFAYFKDLTALIGLGFGGSLISIFARLGGGIYTKGADIGADLVGKIEAGIPEDDIRNPAVIADNVGDNVGDDAGMAADLFETYVVTAIAVMLLGSSLFPENDAIAYFPLMIGAVAIFASIIGTFFVYVRDDAEKIMNGLYKGLAVSAVISAILFLPVSLAFFPREISSQIYGAGIVGLVVTWLLILVTEYYTAKQFRPVRSIAHASTTGHATNIIMGLSVSMEATIAPVLVICAGILSAYWIFGIFGIAVAAMAMLSLAGMIIAIDAFGPITDNAGGIAEMSGLSEDVRRVTDALDSVGNTTKAITKGYAIGSAGLASLVLFASYVQDLKLFGLETKFDLTNPYIVVGLFLGASMPYIFSSMALKAVGRAGKAVVEDVRRQFRENKGIMDGTSKPDYARTVDIVTKAAIHEMIAPALLPVVVPIVIFFLMGAHAAEVIGGLLMGSIISGIFVAISMTAGGAAWDNAKKFIEEGNYGGKKSLAHQAAITGDTVGDPYKDTAGPAINPMIKIVNIVALLLARLM
ncbi:MAG: sodium-translocating pyrophosphatase [Patescibacteria group bacterium]